MAKRQTIWLSTMMVLSLMLIGFYTVNNNVQEVGAPDAAKTSVSKPADQPQNQVAANEPSDWFTSYHLQESQQISKREEELQNVIATGKSTAEIDKATKELDQLTATSDKAENVVDMIVKEGYPDAIVEMKDDKINVIVQSQDLDKKKAVKIMDMVAKEMKVASRQVIVSAHE